MWFQTNLQSKNESLELFALRLREGYLIGLAARPSIGSPCADCVQKWLEERKIVSVRIQPDAVKVRKDLIADLIRENQPHVFHEIFDDGTSNRMENLVFPHPKCACAKEAFQLPAVLNWESSLSFSPIGQAKSARYTTPNGHVWLTSTTGRTPVLQQLIRTTGFGSTKEISRRRAVENWLRQAAYEDFSAQQRIGSRIATENLQTANHSEWIWERTEGWGVTGVGENAFEASLDGMYQLTLQRTLRRYASQGKSPLLVVGANHWLRARVPFFLLQEYDLHLVFYPNSSPCWILGLVAFSRLRSSSKPTFIFSASHSMQQAIDEVLGKAVEMCRPDPDYDSLSIPPISGGPLGNPEAEGEAGKRLNLWWTHWIYRCSKINWKDIIGLEPYPKELNLWREYYRDGQPPVSLIPLNSSGLPSALRSLIHVRIQEPAQPRSKILGIGTMRDFQTGV